MESLPSSPLLKVTQEDVDYSRNVYNVEDASRIKESIDAIIEWMGKQAHLAESSKYITREYLERIYMLARGSTENAKKKIDKVFTMRAMLPEMCLHRTLGEFDKLLTTLNFVPMPRLNPREKTRVLVTKIINKNLDDFSLLDYCRYANMIGEYRMYHDYSAGDRFILDLNRVSIISKMNPVVMKKFDIVGAVYSTKVKGVHIVNAPPYIDTLVTLVKSTMSEKVGGRLHVHNSFEELHQHINKDVLPEDFGGNDLSVAKLAEKWREHLRTPEIIKLIADQDKLVSDESKRISTNTDEDLMGMPGSFRKLNVD